MYDTGTRITGQVEETEILLRLTVTGHLTGLTAYTRYRDDRVYHRYSVYIDNPGTLY